MSDESYFNLQTRPTCPTIMIPFQSRLYALPLITMKISCEFNVSTAFIKVEGTWRNIAKYKSDCIYCLPLNGTVTEVSIKIQQEVDKRSLETIIIPKKDAEEMAKEAAESRAEGGEGETLGDGEEQTGQLPADMKFDDYIPNLFRLPIQDVEPGDVVTVSAIFIEPLIFAEGKYHFTMPLTFPQQLLSPSMSVNEALSIRCVINSVTPDAKASSDTHTIRVTQPEQVNKRSKTREVGTEHAMIVEVLSFEPTEEELQEDENKASKDFHLAYSITSTDILPTFIDEPVEGGEETEGNFLLFVTPPSFVEGKSGYSRRMFFLLDKSGSMTGEPYEEAKRALVEALKKLDPDDQFAVIAFDHEYKIFPDNSGEGLLRATQNNIQRVEKFADEHEPTRGGTEILKPLEVALDILMNTNQENGKSLPFIVLLTDGCVNNEREICQMAAAKEKACQDEAKATDKLPQPARILTFGIGSYCNWFFLKMLATIGRGFSDVVVYKEKIFGQIVQLINMASHPVLTNVQLAIPGDVQEVQLYPFPIPDLFMGAPLTITGKYQGQLPAKVGLQGNSPDGTVFRKRITVRPSDVIPVSKVFIKQRIDVLSAKAWLDESDEIEEEVVDLSCTETMPSPYTVMVAFEPDEETKKEIDDMIQEDDEFDLENADENEELLGNNKSKRKKKAWYKNKKALACIAAGNIAIVGALAFSFGDVGATLDNLPVIGSLFGESIDIGDLMECCGECGGCDCGCDCGNCDIADCLVC